MTVNELAKALGLAPLAVPDGERQVTGGYAGDLLSWVMGRARSGDAWVTIMSNANICAVAVLSGAAAVILAEGVIPEKEVLELAEAKSVNILSSQEGTFELCGRISALL